MHSLRRTLRCALVGLLLAGAVSCTETDEQLIEDVGVTRLLLLDSGIRPQQVEVPPEGMSPDDERVQAVTWEVAEATLLLSGATIDLLQGEACFFRTSTVTVPVVSGACASGVVLESREEPYDVTLLLGIAEMVVRREALVDLERGGDFDGDTVLDENDNCPLIANTSQAEEACLNPAGSPDSDADGVRDAIDNCVAVGNPAQEDDGVGALGDDPQPSNGIGDACTEQRAEVEIVFPPSAPDFGFDPVTLDQDLGLNTYITVDFHAEALRDCDWEDGRCTLDSGAVKLCTHTNLFEALGGCP